MAMIDEEGKSEDVMTTKTKTAGLDADVIQIGNYTFQVIIDILKEENGTFFVIRATEITTKDVFEFKRDEKTLLSMNWPNKTINSVKQFITSTIFNPDDEMTIEYGFTKKKSKQNNDDEKKKDNNDEPKLSNIYNECDDMIILIELQYKWMASNWRLDLKYIPQDEVKRLKVLVKDLREEIKQLKSFQCEFKGMIVMWSGSISDIPKGWVICDGQNNTPDLRDRFILGSNGNNIGSKGGNKTHSHNITVQGHRLSINEIPSHNHKIEATLSGYSGTSTPAMTSPGGNSQFSKWDLKDHGGHIYTYTSGGGNAHSHSAASNSTQHMPPYYTLGFIMKL